MRGLIRVLVIALTVVTLTLGGTVAASAHAGTFGSQRAGTDILAGHIELVVLHHDSAGTSKNAKDNTKDNGDNNGEGNDRRDCREKDKKHHPKVTKGHKHHPCGGDDDTD